jgi:hypothetical protein
VRTSGLPLLLFFFAFFAFAGCTAARDSGFGYTQHPRPLPKPPPVSFVWPTAEGWKHETIPFPLEFAPDLPYRGTEELRFAPGFFEPSAPGYFSYAFVWWIASGPRLERATVEAHLKQYFVGLTKAVAKNEFEPDLSRIDTHLESNVEPGLVGTVRTIDAFKTRSEIVLNVRAKTGACGDRHFLLVKASPKPMNDPTWASLNEVAASFQCD